jgi:hypothetical protein
MNKSPVKWVVAYLAAILAFQVPAFLPAEETRADASSAQNRSESTADGEAKPAKEKGLPFRGTLGSINRSESSITVKGKEKDRVFKITSQTRILKDGKAAKLDDGVVGEEVAGYAKETASGTLEAISLRFGTKPADSESGRNRPPDTK